MLGMFVINRTNTCRNIFLCFGLLNQSLCISKVGTICVQLQLIIKINKS